MSNKQTVIIVPTYNERHNVTDLVRGVEQAVPAAKLIIIDDHSPDGTAKVMEELVVTRPWLKLISRAGKSGQGSAYKFALTDMELISHATAVVTMDADGSHSPAVLPLLLKNLADYDLIIGSRYVAGGQTVGWSRGRKILSWTANFLTRHLLGLKIKDATSGLVAMHGDLARQIPWEKIDARGYAFHVELKHYAVKKLRAKVLEVPITFADRQAGESKISLAVMLEWLVIIGELFLRRLVGY
ncbi:MAG: polyprenol monophosphomannose synthase [bacterium]|nr:polyprenol monophosphomannose synthase [bacterium]